jgi:hypothetical protein
MSDILGTRDLDYAETKLHELAMLKQIHESESPVFVGLVDMGPNSGTCKFIHGGQNVHLWTQKGFNERRKVQLRLLETIGYGKLTSQLTEVQNTWDEAILPSPMYRRMAERMVEAKQSEKPLVKVADVSPAQLVDMWWNATYGQK